MGYRFLRYTRSVSPTKIHSLAVICAKLSMIVDAELKANGAKDISPVTAINGADAVYYLEANVAVTLGFQDPDAR